MSQGPGETGGDWRDQVSKAIAAAHDTTPGAAQRAPLTHDNANNVISDIFVTEIKPPINEAMRAMATSLIRFAGPRFVGADTLGKSPYYPKYRELSTGMLVVGEPDEKTNANSVAHGIRISLSRTSEGLKAGARDHEPLGKLCNGTESPTRATVTEAADMLGALLPLSNLSVPLYELKVDTRLIGNRPELLDDMAGVYRCAEALPHLTWPLRLSKAVDNRGDFDVERKLEEHSRGVFAKHPEVDCWMAPLALFTDPSDPEKSFGSTKFGVPELPYYGYAQRQTPVEESVNRLLEPARLGAANAKIITEILGEVRTPLREFDFATAAWQ